MTCGLIDTGFAIHLQAKGVNKATAFMDLANDLGIPPGEFLAIGDAINDVEMLKACGNRGYRCKRTSGSKGRCRIYRKKQVWRWVY